MNTCFDTVDFTQCDPTFWITFYNITHRIEYCCVVCITLCKICISTTNHMIHNYSTLLCNANAANALKLTIQTNLLFKKIIFYSKGFCFINICCTIDFKIFIIITIYNVFPMSHSCTDHPNKFDALHFV